MKGLQSAAIGQGDKGRPFRMREGRRIRKTLNPFTAIAERANVGTNKILSQGKKSW